MCNCHVFVSKRIWSCRSRLRQTDPVCSKTVSEQITPCLRTQDNAVSVPQTRTPCSFVYTIFVSTKTAESQMPSLLSQGIGRAATLLKTLLQYYGKFFLPGVAYPRVRDNRSTLNTKTGYEKKLWDCCCYIRCPPYVNKLLPLVPKIASTVNFVLSATPAQSSNYHSPKDCKHE